MIVAEAKRESQIERGAGEAVRTQVLNDAFGQDESFFNFYRSMQAYEAAFTSASTYMVLSPDSEFLDFFSAIERKPGEWRVTCAAVRTVTCIKGPILDSRRKAGLPWRIGRWG